MSTVGKRIHDRRIELGLSADTVAEKLGKNRATIYRYEGDDIENMPLQIISPLAEILHVSPAYLMGWTDDISDGYGELIRLLSKLPENVQNQVLDLVRTLSGSHRSNKDQEA